MSGEKPQSKNPFEYGEKYFKRLRGEAKETTEQVIAVVGDLVCFGNGPHSWKWMHYKRLQETLDLGHWKKIYPRKWEDLTAENWRERRDMGVWVRDNVNVHQQPVKLIGFEPKGNCPYKIVNKDGGCFGYLHASIYNDDGEEARWEEVQ